MKVEWNRPMISHSPAETRAIAAGLLEHLPARAVIALYGQLGAGKTCFVQGLARAMGITRPVTSPTFTIVNEYRGARLLRHIDLYRLGGPDDVLALGFEEYLEDDGIVAVEWPERAGDLLPTTTIHVHLDALPNRKDRSILLRRADPLAAPPAAKTCPR